MYDWGDMQDPFWQVGVVPVPCSSLDMSWSAEPLDSCAERGYWQRARQLLDAAPVTAPAADVMCAGQISWRELQPTLVHMIGSGGYAQVYEVR